MFDHVLIEGAGPRNDEVRSGDLAYIVDEVSSYSRKRKLPDTLDKLKLDAARLHDPVTNLPYPYRPLDAKTFQVCTTFQTDTTTSEELLRQAQDKVGRTFVLLMHHAGHKCFQFAK